MEFSAVVCQQACCVTLGKGLNLSGMQFSFVKNSGCGLMISKVPSALTGCDEMCFLSITPDTEIPCHILATDV